MVRWINVRFGVSSFRMQFRFGNVVWMVEMSVQKERNIIIYYRLSWSHTVLVGI